MRHSRRSTASNRRNSIAGRWRPWLQQDSLPAEPDDTTPLAASQGSQGSPDELSLWPDEALGDGAQTPRLE